MNRKLLRLAERRGHLITQAAAQRTTLARNIAPLRIPLAQVDEGLAALRYLRDHPIWIVGGSVLLAAFRPGRALKWLGRGWVAWQLMKKMADLPRSSADCSPPFRSPLPLVGDETAELRLINQKKIRG